MAKAIYTAEASVTGGRLKGHGKTTDSELEVDLRIPKELGGEGGGTNPEELFAVGFAACFEGALSTVARRQKVDADDAVIECATFELRSAVDPESLPVLQNYLSPGAADAGVRIVASEKVDRVTLEIGTMLPHEAILNRTVRSMARVSGGTVSTENTQRRRVRFTYVKEQ